MLLVGVTWAVAEGVPIEGEIVLDTVGIADSDDDGELDTSLVCETDTVGLLLNDSVIVVVFEPRLCVTDHENVWVAVKDDDLESVSSGVAEFSEREKDVERESETLCDGVTDFVALVMLSEGLAE